MFTPAMKRGQARDLDDKLGPQPRAGFVGECLCGQIVTEYDDGTVVLFYTRTPHVCPGPKREPIPLPLAAPQRAPLAGEPVVLEREAGRSARSRGVLDLGG